MAQCLGCTQDNLSRTNPADANNLIDICKVPIEDGDRLILIDTGMGNKQSEKFFGYYSVGTHSMDKSLANIFTVMM
jgi:hypothetical protein